MPGSTVPLSVPVCVLRLSPDEIDALWLWFVAVMRGAGIPDPQRRAAITTLNNTVEAAILAVREEAAA